MSRINAPLVANHYTLADVVRYCADIGMPTLDRSIPVSCNHRTSYCDAHCFNVKLYNAYRKGMTGKDVKNEAAWAHNDAHGLARKLSRSRKAAHGRVRLMSRGEAFSDHGDIARVEALLVAMPERIFWVPTRAWRNALIWARVQDLAARFSNLRVLASLDPSNSVEEWASLDAASIMFFGDDAMTHNPANGRRMFKCPKTHAHLKGHCNVCKAGCFKASGPVNVHLKQH